MSAFIEPGATAGTVTPMASTTITTNNQTIPNATEIFSNYERQFTKPVITDDYSLVNWFAGQTPNGDLGVGIVNKPLSTCSNLCVIRRDGAHRFLNPIQSGEFAPCSCYLDAQAIIAAENYLSALVLAARYEHRNHYVVASFEAWNIGAVLLDFADRWPNVKPIAAPDSDVEVVPKTITTLRPPPGLSWLDLHMWEVNNQWAA